MPRLALKPDASFFRKITLGAVGARAVCDDLARYGHKVVELERGSTDTKLWKDVKRKRVRIPDLVCQRCGLRVESRAKTKAELSMSHSPTEESRRWDFGMVDADCIAFPVCQVAQEEAWSRGGLALRSAYWRQRSWVEWEPVGRINYVRVGVFRSVGAARSTTKGVTEGSETSVAWDAIFATQSCVVESTNNGRITIGPVPVAGGRRSTRRIRSGLQVVVCPGDTVEINQVIASAVTPEHADRLACTGALPEGHLRSLLKSRERTQRFTGVKLARLTRDRNHRDLVSQLTNDDEEDVYIRLEGASYLVSVWGESVRDRFEPFYQSQDKQSQLETVIAVGETATAEAVEFLAGILGNPTEPYFLRSAAAWSLGKAEGWRAATHLMDAFRDVDADIREQALEGIVSIGAPAVPFLLKGLREADHNVAAGCAEALRQQVLPAEAVAELEAQLHEPTPSLWSVWLAGHLPRDQIAARIANLQDTAPGVHYAVSLLWSFVESWISRHWELRPHPGIGSDV